MTTKSPAVRQFTVHHDGVTIPVTRGGQGRPLVFVPGLTSTQAELHELLALLRRDFDVLSFDLRGHGMSSAAATYNFAAFLADLTAVLASPQTPAAPILAGHSLGADLIVHYAAAHPVAELVLIDGANPIPEPFITDLDLPQFRTLWADAARWHETHRGTERQVLLTAQQILDLNLELDVLRAELLTRYRGIDCPIHLIASTAMAGDSADGRVPRHNRLWRAGIDRLVAARPRLTPVWLDASHGLVLTHAPEIAQILRDL
ncbi:alpha/beta hydrolase [Nocardia sp. NPDC050712]|uniref:alpha/beta fold hydrolase n=1 Tax=Nocardia sp. NPDC050712 TaxID=3155518 RepID=UPI0033C1D669